MQNLIATTAQATAIALFDYCKWAGGGRTHWAFRLSCRFARMSTIARMKTPQFRAALAASNRGLAKDILKGRA